MLHPNNRRISEPQCGGLLSCWKIIHNWNSSNWDYVCIPRSFLVINVCNQGNTLCSSCIVLQGLGLHNSARFFAHKSRKYFWQMVGIFKSQLSQYFSILSVLHSRPLDSKIYFVVCLATSPKVLTKRVLQRARSIVSSFKSRDLIFVLLPSSSCLSLIFRLPLPSMLPFLFPSIICFRRQYLRSIHLVYLCYILCLVLHF